MKKLIYYSFLFLALTVLIWSCENKKTNKQVAAPADSMSVCKALEVPDSIAAMRPQYRVKSGAVPARLKPVGIYYEYDYSMYVYLGGTVAACQSHLNRAFQIERAIYAADSVDIYIAGVGIDTVQDGMGGNLMNFGAHMAVVRPHADFAQLLTRQWSGGIAYINAYCLGWNYQVSVCGVTNNINPFPQYCWDGEVMAHELGHLLGLYHTFACRFNGNNTPIDSSNRCWGIATEGGCPNGQITDLMQLQSIMSYAHGCPGGILFTHGFGGQQRNLLRQAIYSHSTCLVDTGNPPPPPPDSCMMPTAPSVWNLTPTTAKLQWINASVLTNVRGYSVWWKLSSASTWTIVPNMVVAYYNLASLTPATSYDWKVQTVCNNGTSDFTPVITFTTPQVQACATPTGMFTDNITATSARATWSVAGAVRSNLWLRVGSSGAWAQNIVNTSFFTWTNLLPSTTYQWQVQNVCLSGTSNWSTPFQSFTTKANADPCSFTISVTDCQTGNQHTFSAKVTNGSVPTFVWKLNGVQAGTSSIYSGVFNVGNIVSLTVNSAGCATPKTYTKTIQN